MPDTDYHVSLFKEKGFERRQCPSCKSFFWAQTDAQTCGETPCQEYDFIGKPPTSRPFTLREMRESFLSFLEKRDHKRLSRYPVVARWRGDVFFTQASIYPFQPWVVSGQEKPPANPLAISQPCVRFNDIHNVGRTGQHFTMFEMMAHHVFNYPDKTVYFKDKTVELCNDFLTATLGIDQKAVKYKEAWWSGGGNSGPCFEVILGGAEAATLVFMMNREENGKDIPMDIQVVDTGYGLERFTWLSQGTPSAYEAVFEDVLAKLKEQTDASIEDRILQEYSKVAGLTKVETIADVREIRKKVAVRIGIDYDELLRLILPLESLYILCDHTRALTFLLADGVVPSNVRDGYFARLVVRRAIRAIETLNLEMRLEEIVAMQLDEFKDDFPELEENRESMMKITRLEEERFRETLLKGQAVVTRLEEKLKQEQGRITSEHLVELYDSHGLNPEIVAEFATDTIDIPDDFYARVAARHEKREEVDRAPSFPTGLPTTRLRVYEDEKKSEFTANVAAVEGNIVVLDETFFYPEGGGQEADRGSIEGHKVSDVQKSGKSVLHFLEGPPDLKVGQTVRCVIDWERRLSMTRHHSATHLVLAAARKLLGSHVWQAGAHKSDKDGRLDITHYDALKPEEKEEIEKRVNESILADIPVKKSFISREEAEKKFGFRLYQGGAAPGAEVRVVQIPELDVEACGGTHVDRTGEIGPFKILRTKRIQDGVVRLEYAAGRRALEEMQKESRMLNDIADTIGTAPEQLPEAVAKLCSDWKEMRKEVDRLNKERLTLLAGRSATAPEAGFETIEGVRVYTRVVTGDARELVLLAKDLLKGGKAVAVLGAEGATASIAVGRSDDVDLDCRKVIAEGAIIIGGKGGGKPDFAQGGGPYLAALRKAVEKMREEVISRLRTG